ncbi:S8 family serine peptidase [Actinoplanes sp. CA-015351]|uniref:S8 family serine peptidase n=1 Tax=Actinoplanes sp. CA-015351 TaxID=3239897 RepID=UPI003D989D98
MRHVAFVAVAVLVGVLAPAPAFAAPGVNCAEPGENEIVASWARSALRATTIGTVADGTGARVAILSTGVDAGQPQLRQRVFNGVDTVDGGLANQDCTGTGTQVAGVVAGRAGGGAADHSGADNSGADGGGAAGNSGAGNSGAGGGGVSDGGGDSGAGGLAPNSRILPIRVQLDDPAGSEPDPDAIAVGLNQAVSNGADVAVVVSPVYEDDPDLEAAVAAAIDQGVVVVAAVGDLGGADEGNPTPYPAAYRDVIGVGAIDQNGRIWPDSQRGDFVDLVAPGVAVPVLQTGRGFVEVSGTGVAAGFVGAAAALLHDRKPDLSARAVGRLLAGTAAPAPSGPAFGAGVVDPYAAITGQLAPAKDRALPAVEPAPLPDTTAEKQRRTYALVGALFAGILAVAVAVAAAAMRRSRRQQWRPAMASPPPARDEPLEPGPPVMLLDERIQPAEAGRR